MAARLALRHMILSHYENAEAKLFNSDGKRVTKGISLATANTSKGIIRYFILNNYVGKPNNRLWY